MTQPLVLHGLNTQGLHLKFTAEIPGLVAVSIPYLPTELPDEAAEALLSKHGVIHEHFRCKKRVQDVIFTTGMRVLVMAPTRQSRPWLLLGGIPARSSTTVWSSSFPTTAGTLETNLNDNHPGHDGNNNNNNNNKQAESGPAS